MQINRLKVDTSYIYNIILVTLHHFVHKIKANISGFVPCSIRTQLTEGPMEYSTRPKIFPDVCENKQGKQFFLFHEHKF